jgi:flagellar biosynthesis GTPase FlhF
MSTIVVRAPDSAQAMEEVLRRLGADAFILSTTQSNGQVEIRATSEAAPRRPVVTAFADALRAKVDAPAPAGRVPGALAVTGDLDLTALEERLREEFLPDPSVPHPVVNPATRLILVGPAGGGKSMLAARLAAAIMRAGRGRRPRLIQPLQGVQLAEDRLRGWARLMGLLVERPQLDDLARSVDWLPDDEEFPQIVDLSDLPDVTPDQVAELAAPQGSQVVLVLPVGLNARRIAALVRPWTWLGPHLCLTRMDEADPTPEELAALVEFGLPLTLMAGGTGLLDALHRPTITDLRQWAEGWWRDAPAAPRLVGPALPEPALSEPVLMDPAAILAARIAAPAFMDRGIA